MSDQKNLFGEKVILEEKFQIVYSGSSFAGGLMPIKSLYTELKSLEELLKDSILIMIETGKLGAECRDYDLLIELKEGSFLENVKLIFKNKKTYKVLALVVPFLVVNYEMFLKKDDQGKVLGEYAEEIQMVGENSKYKKNLSNLLSPLSSNDDCIFINNGEINYNVNFDQKEEIVKNIKEDEQDDEYSKNGIFEEYLVGTIRKLDLDASKNNIFGFNISKGQSKVPTSIKGEFNLLDYKDIIDVPIKVRANVDYKNDSIRHIEIISYEILEKKKQEKMELTVDHATK